MFLRHASLSGGDAKKEFSEMVTIELGVEVAIWEDRRDILCTSMT